MTDKPAPTPPDPEPASIEDALRRLLEQTDISRLPGAGKPLNLDDDPYAPDEMKLANKLLRDNELVPEWIAESRELDERRARLLAQVRRALSADRCALSPSLRAQVVELNKRLLSYNLKAPAGVAHKRLIDLEREQRRAGNG